MARTAADLFRRTARRLLRPAALSKTCLTLLQLEERENPAGTITGVVFQDFNANGVRDTITSVPTASGVGSYAVPPEAGIANVRVIAVDVAGAIQGDTRTDANGNYLLAPGGTGPYRVQFLTLPAGTVPGPLAPPGAVGTTSGATVRFVPDGNTSGINLGVVDPNQIAPIDPLLFTSRYVFGNPADPTNPNAGEPVIISFPYSSGSATGGNGTSFETPTGHDLAVPFSQVGTTFGTAFNPVSGELYAAEFMKRHTGFGPGAGGAPNSAGVIYRMNTPSAANPTVSSASVLIDLNAVLGGDKTGTNFRATAGHDFFRDGLVRTVNFDPADPTRILSAVDTGWDAVGKISLGGLDILPDGSRLFVMNLADRKLYSVGIRPDGSANTADVQAFNLPVPTGAGGVTGITGANPLGDLRPFAVQYYNGKIYVGAVNSAESTNVYTDNGPRNGVTRVGVKGNPDALRAYVFEFNPATNTFTPAPLLNAPLNYERGFANPGLSADWNAWSPVFPDGLTQGGYAQPELTSLAFDPQGNLVLGLRDRSGDQFGNYTPADPTIPNPTVEQLYFGIPAGDVLRAFNTSGGYVLENNGVGPNGEGTAPTPGDPSRADMGPGGAEYYYQDNTAKPSSPEPGFPGPTPAGNRHDEIAFGAVLQLPGFSEVASTVFNPNPNPDFVGRGGLRWFNNTTGAMARGYEVYETPFNTIGQNSFHTFSKANGLGELVARIAPPVAIGDRVWLDADRDGVQDAGEAGVAGLTVELFDANGVKLASATTDADGRFLFSSQVGAGDASTILNLRLTPAVGYEVRLDLSQPQLAGLVVTQKNAGSPTDPTAVDSDAVAGGSTAVVTIPTHALGVMGQSNTTFDIGLSPMPPPPPPPPPLVIGDTVWEDANNDGIRQPTEALLQGVAVRLLDASGTVLQSATTDVNGHYLFQVAKAGTYRVEITAPAGYVSSTGAGNSGSPTGAFEPAPATDDNDADHGTTADAAARIIQARQVTLTDPAVTPNPDVGGTGNLRQDFGLWRPLAIGNRVWLDADNNGRFDRGEQGLAEVRVQLVDVVGGNVVAATVTNTAGGYLFPFLLPGRYRVRIDASSLPPNVRSSSGTGVTGATTGPFEPATGTTGDNTDHGTDGPNFVTGPVVNLGVGTQPTGEEDTPGIVDQAADANSNREQDFGFTTFSPPPPPPPPPALLIGDTVWDDANNDGIRQGSETLLQGVPVRLLDAGGNVLQQTTTDGSGQYLFQVQQPGTYQVEVTAPAGYVSSTGAGNSGTPTGAFEPAPRTDDNDADHGTTADAAARIVRARPITLTDATLAQNPDANGTGNLRQDFGLWRPLSVGNLVWLDADNNGRFDSGETGLNGVGVQLVDADTANVVATTTTNSSGGYLFPYLLPGRYRVRIDASTLPLNVLSSSGTGVTGAKVGPFEAASGTTGDSTDHGTEGTTFVTGPVIDLRVGTQPTGEADTPGLPDPAADANSNREQDFGFTSFTPAQGVPASVSGYVYIDQAINGVRDVGTDQGIPGVLLTLTGTRADGTPITPQTMRTDRTGFYEFSNLEAGTYTITETQPFGQLYDGTDTVGSLGGAAGNDVLTVALAATDAGVEYNFGEFQPMAVYGTVYYDANRNGVRDANEVGIPNTAVAITGTAFAGTPFARTLRATDSPIGLVTTTDALGQFQFPVLPPGVYNLVEAQPAGYDDGLESSRDPQPASNQPTVGNDVFTGIGPAPSRVRGPFDFGEVLTTFGGDMSKRSFLGGDAGTGGPIGLPIGGGIPATVPDVPLNQNRSILVGDPTRPTVAAVGAGVGAPPLVRVFDYSRGFESFRFFAYEPTFTGGVRVATADLNADGIPDIVTVPGPGGGPVVKVWDGSNGALLSSFFAFEDSFRDGLFVALGDVNRDNRPEVILGTDVGGGPHVRVINLVTGTDLSNFFAFDSATRAGVRVASADLNGDGQAEVITTTGPGPATLVRVYDLARGALAREFAPFGSGFAGGAFLSTGDTNGDGTPDIIASVDGGAPAVASFDGRTNATLAAFYAFDPSFAGGARVAAADLTGDGRDDFLITPGPGGAPVFRAVDAGGVATVDMFDVLDPNFRGGLYPAGV